MWLITTLSFLDFLQKIWKLWPSFSKVWANCASLQKNQGPGAIVAFYVLLIVFNNLCFAELFPAIYVWLNLFRNFYVLLNFVKVLLYWLTCL